MSRRTTTALIGLATAAALSLSACGSDEESTPFSSGGDKGDTIVVGSANFPENELLMNIYAGALEAEGVKVETKPNIGAREIYLKAFEDGDIGLLPEYNGALLAYLSGDAGIPEGVSSPEQVADALTKVLPKGSEVLKQSSAEDKDTLTVTKETADKYKLASIEDLKAVAGQLVAGGGPEFKERTQGLVGLKSVYGVEFKQFKPLDAGGPLTIAALGDGSIDVGNVFSTDPNIAKNKWISLEDPKNLFTAQNVVPLIKSDLVNDKVTKALDGVSTALTIDNLTEMMASIVLDKADPKTVAEKFLADNNLD